MQRPCSETLTAPAYGKYYVYSSGPALSHVDRPKKPKPTKKKSGTCFANHATNIRTRGAHEFYNMMWDPSVYRGNTVKPYEKCEMDRCNKKRREMDSSIKRRKFPRRLIGGIERPRLSLEDQVEKIGFGDMGMQTEEFLQEMATDVIKKGMCTQFDIDVDPWKGLKGEGERVLNTFIIGCSQSCQTDQNPHCAFEDDMLPIQKDLCTKIMQQSLLETTEELEIESIRKEKRKYIQLRSEELYKLKRAVEAQQLVAEERSRALNEREREANVENEAEARLSAGLFSAGCISGLWPITFGVLKLEGYMEKSGANDIYNNLLPWMDKEVRKSYIGRQIVSRKLLDEMLHNVASHREAEIASNEFLSTSLFGKQGPSNNFSISEDDPSNTTSKAIQAP